MTDLPRAKPPLSPSDYIKLTPGPQHKLLSYAELIAECVDAGLNDYQIWRYLTRVVGVKTARMTVVRFRAALKSGTLPGPASRAKARKALDEGAAPRPSSGRGEDEVTMRGREASDAISPSDEAYVPPREAEAVRVPPTRGDVMTVSPDDESLRKSRSPVQPDVTDEGPNEPPETVTFDRSAIRSTPKVRPAPRASEYEPGTVIRTYSMSDPEAARKLYAFREAQREGGADKTSDIRSASD